MRTAGIFGFRRDRTNASTRLLEAARGIGDVATADAILRSTIESVHLGVPSSRASIWLTNGMTTPVLALSNTPAEVPGEVVECVGKRRLLQNAVIGSTTAPITGPRTGLHGVLYVLGTTPHLQQSLTVEAIARVAGLALDAAMLHDQVALERDRSASILAHIADAVVVTDSVGEIRITNLAANRIFGEGSPPGGARSCREWLGLSDDVVALECSQGCALLGLSGGGSGAGVEVYRESGKGRRQPLLASVEAVRNPEGVAVEIVHSFRDITRLKEADEAKTIFLATASHELKTPLTVIGGFAETLLRSGHLLSAGVRDDALRAISSRSQQLNSLVDRLLLSSSIEAGRMDLSPETFDVRLLIQERVSAIAEATGRTIDVQYEQPIPQVLADLAATSSIIEHLVENAIKFAPDEGRVAIAVRAAGTFLEIEVSDEGIGMDAEQVARCFDKFWRGDGSETSRAGGTGIGLYIVRSLALAMGGRVQVRSRVGEGTVFLVGIPIVGAQESSASNRAAPDIRSSSAILEVMRQIGIGPSVGKGRAS